MISTSEWLPQSPQTSVCQSWTDPRSGQGTLLQLTAANPPQTGNHSLFAYLIKNKVLHRADSISQ